MAPPPQPLAAPPGFQVPSVRCAVLVRAGARSVWRALSQKEGWEGWFCTRALADVRPGGFLHFRWRDFGPDRYTGDNRCEVLEVEERRRLAFAWKSHDTHPRTRVDIRLEPRGPLTVVRLEEAGWGDAVQAAMDNSVGWGECLAWLKVWVEHGIRFDGRRVDARKPSSRRR